MLLISYISCLLTWLSPRSTLFPYTTLFRSRPSIDWVPSVQAYSRLLACCSRCIARRSPWNNDRLQHRLLLGEANAEVYQDRKSTRLNSSHANISYAVFCLKK